MWLGNKNKKPKWTRWPKKSASQSSPLNHASTIEFILILDHSDGHYLVGETIFGQILLVVDDSKVSDVVSDEGNEKIDLKFYGEVKISPQSFSFKQICREVLIDERVRLQDDQDSGTGKRLHPHNTTIPFMFKIPENLPGTLKDEKFGQIQYQIMATVGSSNQKTIEVVVHSNPKIPHQQQLLNPVMIGCNQAVGWIFTKIIRIRCELPRTGFQIGTELPLKCMIDNRSTRSMSLEIKLSRNVQLKRYRRTIHHHTTTTTFKQFKKTLLRKFVTNVEPYCIVQHSTTLDIPARIPIIHDTCNLIQIDYYVEIVSKIAWQSKLCCKLPIILHQ